MGVYNWGSGKVQNQCVFEICLIDPKTVPEASKHSLEASWTVFGSVNKIVAFVVRKINDNE